MAHLAAASESDPFRRLVEVDIGVDEYVKSLDDRVRERQADERPPAPAQQPPPPDPAGRYAL